MSIHPEASPGKIYERRVTHVDHSVAVRWSPQALAAER
jgi:hypothetical protein